jgi:carboxymethylenebutenolidase
LGTEAVLLQIQKSEAVVAAVFYGSAQNSSITKPILCHISGPQPADRNPMLNKRVFYYPTADAFFAVPADTRYSSASSALAHSRNLSFLKPLMGGPYFDLEAIWDEHTTFEFGERDLEKTMATMVQEPYVNHVPTMTGGIGRADLTKFYRERFIFSNPEDTKMDLVSRTVGIDRVIDEFVFSFTHDRIIDWMYAWLLPT